MGGYGSGRWGGRPAVENSLTLDLSHLFKTGWLKAGASTTGTLRWSIAGSTGQIASVDFESCLGEESGGRRWWFICPRTGRLASRVPLQKIPRNLAEGVRRERARYAIFCNGKRFEAGFQSIDLRFVQQWRTGQDHLLHEVGMVMRHLHSDGRTRVMPE